MGRSVFFAKFFYNFVKAEKLYLFNSFLISFILCFVLILLLLSKEIYAHYANSESALLPDAIALVDEDLEFVTKTLQSHNLKNLLHGELLTMKDASFSKSESSAQFIPKDYTLLAFNLDASWHVTLTCGTENIQTQLQDLYMLKRGIWTLKTEPITCHEKNLLLQTPTGNIPLANKLTTKRYSLLEYHSNEVDDTIFYPYVIATLQKKFLEYYPSSQYYITREALTPDTQKHAKMIQTLSGILFAGKQRRIIANTDAYKYLNDYEKLSFTIYPQHYLSQERITVIDKLPFPINENQHLNSFIFLANLSSFTDVTFDKRFIFFPTQDDGKALFPNATWIDKNELSTGLENFTTNINSAIIAISLLLFIFMIAFIKSFISRIYGAYDPLARILLLNGLNFKIIATLLVVLFLVAMTTATLATHLMFENINHIFMSYYIDLIEYKVQAVFLYVAFVAMLLLALFFESLSHKKTMKNYKG